MIPLEDKKNAFATRLINIVDRPELGHADVFFLVGGQRFGGLRSVLGLHSEVLHRMLFGEFVEAQIKAPISFEQFDHAPKVFQQFLHFMHTGKANVNGLSDIADLLEIADYFGVTDLTKICSDKIKSTNISSNNSVALVVLAERLRMTDLLKEAWTVVGSKTDDALTDTKSVIKLPRPFLKHLFACGASNVSEVSLIRILSKLGPEMQAELAPLVRLPTIPAKEMLDVVVPSQLFDSQRCMEAMAFQLDPASIKLPSEYTSYRMGYQECHGYGSSYGYGGGYGYGGKGVVAKNGQKDVGKGSVDASDDWFSVLKELD